MKAWHLTMIALALSLASIACSDPGEFAIFETDQAQALPECMSAEFPFEPSLLAARVRNERVGIFLQSSPDVTSKYDVVYFELYQPENVVVGEPIELGAPAHPPPPARGKIAFFSSCAFEHDSLKLGGSLVFDHFDYEAGGVIAGHLVDGHIIDERSGQTLVDDLNGEWHFAVRRGPPYEDFYALPERP